MKTRANHQTPSPFEDSNQIVDLWVLRIYGRLGLTGKLAIFGYEQAERLFRRVGLAEAKFEQLAKNGAPRIRTELARVLAKVEPDLQLADVPAVIQENVARLAKIVTLNALECRLLEFAVLVATDSELSTACQSADHVSLARLHRSLAVILDTEEADIATALSASGALHRSNLLVVDRSPDMNIAHRLVLCTASFAQNALLPIESEIELVRDFVSEAPRAHLGLADFEHLRSEVDVLQGLLRNSLSGRYRGANILLYGPPGTGKTQLARVMADHLGCKLLEVSTECEAGSPIPPSARLHSLRFVQSIVNNDNCMILFDEIEDVFSAGGGSGELSGGRPPPMKGWLNRQLEATRSPTFWLTNDIQQMDGAFLRRFDLILEMPIPPRRQRKRILQQTCGHILEESSIEELADIDGLAPAVASRATAVVSSLGGQLSSSCKERVFRQLVDATLKAQGFKRPARQPALGSAGSAGSPYDLRFLAASHDLVSLSQAMQTQPHGRLLLYGPPGTGKTAYAHWLGRELDKPVVSKRASDLQSAFWGATEELIAAAFRQAEQEDSILLIDEADSFLQDRTLVEQSWRIPMINEMLTQMESFAGLLVFTTNSIESLDKASLRRLDFKVGFSPMSPFQARELLLHYAAQLGMPEGDSDQAQRLARLDALTPGDFAVVARQHRLVPFRDCSAFVSALADECRLKRPLSTPIGFVHGY